MILRKLILLSLIVTTQSIICTQSAKETYQDLWDVIVRCKAKPGETYEQSCGSWYKKFKSQVDDYMDSDESKDTPLHQVAIADNLEAAKLLILNGASIYRRNRHGWLAIHEAALVGSARIVEFLIQNGANPKSVTLDSCSTAWDIAKRHENYNVLHVLKKADHSY